MKTPATRFTIHVIEPQDVIPYVAPKRPLRVPHIPQYRADLVTRTGHGAMQTSRLAMFVATQLFTDDRSGRSRRGARRSITVTTSLSHGCCSCLSGCPCSSLPCAFCFSQLRFVWRSLTHCIVAGFICLDRDRSIWVFMRFCVMKGSES